MYEELFKRRKLQEMIRSTIDMDFTVEQMMKDGFTIKMANFYHELMKKERNSGLWSDEFIDWAHNLSLIHI